MCGNTKKHGPWGRSLISLQHDVHSHASCCAGRQESVKIGSMNTSTFVGLIMLVSNRPLEILSRFVSDSGHLGVAADFPHEALQHELCNVFGRHKQWDRSPTHCLGLCLPWTSVVRNNLCSDGQS
ncbi:hypothetical protein CCHR01_04499 [Colletotrichum chrysophilum]|uniref:Uncharacterized protein n=1 Tax=Colletotrichum chrysophilum TaxID=1836956 RepID=A0AAD9AW32_9PEZI|nr:hypothetical protein CCHR01_04499 [Colletotrichum chrysophilum]